MVGRDGHESTVSPCAPAAIREVARNGADNYGVLPRPLVFVAGKGGTGKTTVAVALWLALAAERRSAVVYDATRVDPEQLLGEWLARHVGGPAAGLLRRSHAFSYFIAAAPGARELVAIGKAVDEARSGGQECVIVDAPATGHALGMLGAPRTFAELAPVGPVANEAGEVRRLLADPAFAAYVGVAAPEPMAVEELLELQRALPAVVGRGLDLVVVNAVHPDRFSDEDAERLQAASRRGPGHALLEAVLVEHRRARREAEQVQRLRGVVEAPLVTLPFVFPPASGASRVKRLARELAGATRSRR